jgi:TBC1 domain family member 5
LTAILFLWGKENPEFSYRQGMNEILAMILIVFATERVQPSQSYLALVPEDLKDMNENFDKTIVE